MLLKGVFNVTKQLVVRRLQKETFIHMPIVRKTPDLLACRLNICLISRGYFAAALRYFMCPVAVFINLRRLLYFQVTAGF